MDKVKIALALLKKHHFWVMTCMVLLLSFVGWFLATSKLWAEYQSERSKIEKKFGDLNKINTEERENQKWIDGLEKETRLLKIKVKKAWDQVYIEQKDHVLKWPAVLGEKNVAKLEALGPNDPIPVNIRRGYLNYIRNEFPQLLKIVDARDERESGTSAGADKKKAREGEEDHDYKVNWDGGNQKEIFAKLDMANVPTDQEVRNTQEDLWVYQALLTIINQLNDRATGNYNAKVKEIQSLLIGGGAAGEFQAGMAEGHVDKLESGSTAAASAPVVSTSAVGRYVDAKGVPLADAGGAAAPAPADGPPPAAGGGGGAAVEFKRMPVVMRLIMDQREISRLLVECANSPLPVEVRQFRLHPRATAKQGQSGGSSSRSGRSDEKEQSSYDVLVEVAGIIYIFNPPDQVKLGDVAAAAADGAQPGAAAPQANAGGNPEGAATPAADEAGGGPTNNAAEPAAAAPDAAAGPAETGNAEGKPEETMEPN